APRQGFLSADRWVLWANYLRNFVLNQMVLLPLLIIALLIVRFLMFLYYPWSSELDKPGTSTVFVMGLIATGGLVLLFAGLTALLYGARMVTSREIYIEDYDHSRWTSRRALAPVCALMGVAIAFCAF